MPIQINEVIIRAIVDNAPVVSPAQTEPSSTDRIMMEEEMLEKVLEIIKEKGER